MQEFPTPAISVIVPNCGRMDHLEKCLKGFATQTLSLARIELILGGCRTIDQEELVRERFAGLIPLVFTGHGTADPWAIRNASIRIARAPLIALYSAELAPHNNLCEYCLNFHERHPTVNRACLLGFDADPLYRRLHPLPPASAEHVSWSFFRAESICCKTAVFENGEFDATFGNMAGAEFALRMLRRIDFTLAFESRITGSRPAPFDLRANCEGQYLAAYYEYFLARKYPGVVAHSWSERIEDSDQLAALMATVRGMDRAGNPSNSYRHRMIEALYSRIEEHARAEGWAAARNALPPKAPGTVGPLLK